MCTRCFSSIHTTMQKGNNTSLFAVHVQPLPRLHGIYPHFTLPFPDIAMTSPVTQPATVTIVVTLTAVL